MIALLYPWYEYVVAWLALIFILAYFALAIFHAVTGATKFLRGGPNVDADVRMLFAENLNVSQDPTRPQDRYAAVNEYMQHRRER